jgi:transcriptional regulator with XRE-family HTH domain
MQSIGTPSYREQVKVLVRATRRATGLSQASFAVLVGTTRDSVAEWEIGRSTPLAKFFMVILDIAKTFGIEMQGQQDKSAVSDLPPGGRNSEGLDLPQGPGPRNIP